MNTYMKIARDKSEQGFINKEGGPFGAIIVDNNGKVISDGNNKVLSDLDPTAHAEIVAIRNACKVLKTYDLSNYILYTSCEPCPMCLSAIIWANIKKVYYGCTRQDAAMIGFRDNDIYEYLEGKKENLLDLQQIDRDECIKVFKKYKSSNGIIY